ncbi:MAG: hypothetical protein CFE26_21160, partial [Verrucomicrobiales bacterium VVV1]
EITFDTGTLSALTTTMTGRGGATVSGPVTGTITIGGGTASLGAVTMAVNTNTFTTTGSATANLNINGGTVTASSIMMANAVNTGIAKTATANINLNGGSLTLASNITRTGGAGTENATITLNGGTLNMAGNSIGGAAAVSLNTQSGTLQNLGQVNSGGAWTKSTAGTVILAGTNTYTGAATVNGGTLSVTGTLNALSSLAVGGGTLSYDNAAPQTVAGLTVNAGSSTVTNTNAGATNILSLGAITRNIGGIVNFANATATNNVIQTTTPNTSGILGPWAFVGSDWAMNDGSGNIVAYTAYTDVARLNPGTIADDATSNVRIIEGTGSAGNITLGAPTTTVNTLLQSDSGGTSAATVDVSSSTLRTGGIVMLSAAGALTVGTAPNSGTLTAATAAGDLSLTNNSVGNPMTINSAIADNTSASSLSKAGAGT